MFTFSDCKLIHLLSAKVGPYRTRYPTIPGAWVYENWCTAGINTATYCSGIRCTHASRSFPSTWFNQLIVQHVGHAYVIKAASVGVIATKPNHHSNRTVPYPRAGLEAVSVRRLSLCLNDRRASVKQFTNRVSLLPCSPPFPCLHCRGYTPTALITVRPSGSTCKPVLIFGANATQVRTVLMVALCLQLLLGMLPNR